MIELLIMFLYMLVARIEELVLQNKAILANRRHLRCGKRLAGLNGLFLVEAIVLKCIP
jgi:hypothetical protein